MAYLNRAVTALIFGIFTFSCISNKRLIYMQNLPPDIPVAVSGELIPHDFEKYLLQYNDVVDITIKTTDSEFNELFEVSVIEASKCSLLFQWQYVIPCS